MRPITLTMNAFGTYLEETTIPFEQFGTSGLVLITSVLRISCDILERINSYSFMSFSIKICISGFCFARTFSFCESVVLSIQITSLRRV